MKKFNKTEINSLSDVFAAWMGGYPETDSEIRNFLEKKDLNGALSIVDVDSILNEYAYFPEELVPAIYSALPLKLVVKGKEISILPQEFNKFNKRVMQSSENVRCLNLSFKFASLIEQKFSDTKKCLVDKEKPRIINSKYRKVHSAEISQRFKARRAKAKAEDVEAVKVADKTNNSRVDRKKICKTYYENHKEEIAEKARANPKVSEYKKKYKVKMRFKKTTGPKILSLLNGIINNNSSR